MGFLTFLPYTIFFCSIFVSSLMCVIFQGIYSYKYNAVIEHYVGQMVSLQQSDPEATLSFKSM